MIHRCYQLKNRNLRAYLHIVRERGKPKMLSRVPTGIQDACCPVSYYTSLKYIFLFLFSNSSLVCVLIHFKLTFLYFSKSLSFGSGYSHPTHTPTHTPRKLYKHPRSIARQVNSSDRPSGTYGQVNQP